MFEWDLTRLTTNAAETHGMWWEEKKKTFVKKLRDAYTYTPAVKAFTHIGSAIRGLNESENVPATKTRAKTVIVPD